MEEPIDTERRFVDCLWDVEDEERLLRLDMSPDLFEAVSSAVKVSSSFEAETAEAVVAEGAEGVMDEEGISALLLFLSDRSFVESLPVVNSPDLKSPFLKDLVENFSRASLRSDFLGREGPVSVVRMKLSELESDRRRTSIGLLFNVCDSCPIANATFPDIGDEGRTAAVALGAGAVGDDVRTM